MTDIHDDDGGTDQRRSRVRPSRPRRGELIKSLVCKFGFILHSSDDDDDGQCEEQKQRNRSVLNRVRLLTQRGGGGGGRSAGWLLLLLHRWLSQLLTLGQPTRKPARQAGRRKREGEVGGMGRHTSENLGTQCCAYSTYEHGNRFPFPIKSIKYEPIL